MDEGSIVLDYESPAGTSLEETDRILKEVEKIIIKTPEVEAYSRRTGTQMGFFITEQNRGDYLIQLKTNRSKTSIDVIDEIRKKVEASQPALRIDFGQVIGDMLGDLMSSVSPIEVKVYGNNQAELQKIASNKNGNSTNAVIRIPVAVHFPAVATTSTLKTCFRQLAQSQINILNADYNGTNEDIANFVNDATFYPDTNTGSLQVEFVLATQNHPSGTGIANGDLAVTFGTDFLGSNVDDTTWAGYLNLVCRNAGNGILGYSNLGGSPAAGNCVEHKTSKQTGKI